MNLQYKRLDSGYHWVKDMSKHHLFAQWPIGVTFTPQYVSTDGTELHPEQLRLFMSAAAELAGTDDWTDLSRRD